MKKILLAVILSITVTLNIQAQSVSAVQLIKLLDVWQYAPPDSVVDYIHSLSPYWSLDRSSMKVEEYHREVSWLYVHQPIELASLTVSTIKNDGKVTDGVAYITEKLDNYSHIVSILKYNKELVNFTKDDDGTKKWVYRQGDTYYIFTVSLPNPNGRIFYTVGIQRRGTD